MGGRWKAYHRGNTNMVLRRKSRGKTYTRNLNASESELLGRNLRNSNGGYTHAHFNDGTMYKNVSTAGGGTRNNSTKKTNILSM